MAYEYTDPSGIKYTNLPSEGFTNLNYKPKYTGNKFQLANNTGVEPFVNAVEIDWNGAIIGES